LPTETTVEPLIIAHRASVLWTLNSLLAKTSAELTELEEERSRRRAERGRTLGQGASREAAKLSARNDLSSRAKGLFGGPNPSGSTSASGSGWTSYPNGSGLSNTAIIDPDEPPIESQLSAEQLQQFESENNVLLEHMQSQLDSVLSAEKSLLEISALQTELVRHLVQQTEVVERLYDEAVGSVAEVGKANEQLKKAKERGGEARLFLLVFLIGASMALLFLDWYA
jgi:syntaxin 18